MYELPGSVDELVSNLHVVVNGPGSAISREERGACALCRCRDQGIVDGASREANADGRVEEFEVSAGWQHQRGLRESFVQECRHQICWRTVGRRQPRRTNRPRRARGPAHAACARGRRRPTGGPRASWQILPRPRSCRRRSPPRLVDRGPDELVGEGWHLFIRDGDPAPARDASDIDAEAGSISIRPSRSRISTTCPCSSPRRTRSGFGMTTRPAESMADLMSPYYHRGLPLAVSAGVLPLGSDCGVVRCADA